MTKTNQNIKMSPLFIQFEDFFAVEYDGVMGGNGRTEGNKTDRKLWS